ncbi:metal-dependent hydrolase [Hymenobacter sp. ASUV-10]|uniref:Metal-dependent hydrolase n=1 Tax=Hymenobacter aranciens TaxID=3063996 RepID=A0ABT9BB91_9BACT|nr:metal-dependent hydrolase [Hymenobacter sp. ASUV-10]MDO7873971.1 metal-dependent hydrolase [Hymenobacter sp. ASUV-10]
MASVFGHVAVGFTLARLHFREREYWPYWLLASALAFLPDADVIGFKFHVPYASLWGHRGLTHSLLAAAVIALAVTILVRLFTKPGPWRPGFGRLLSLLFLATASHGVLDAMTSGGLGVAFLSPWEQERYFFDFRPIKVSPIGVKNFIGERAWLVLRSELIWVGVPCLLVLLLRTIFTYPATATLRQS